MSSFGVFRVIFGLLIGSFILYFFIQFVVNYITVQETFSLATALKSFEKLSNDVYYSGNPSPFLDFKKTKKFDIYVDTNSPAGIRSSELPTKASFIVPTLISPSRTLFLNRVDLDLTFWKFYMVEAVPEIKIIFNPISSDPKIFDFVFEIVNTLPDTGNFDQKITFSLCSEKTLSKSLEAYEFKIKLGSEKNSGASYLLCEATETSQNRIVIIADDCSEKNHICVELPKNSIGRILINGNEIGYYNYDEEIKDIISIVAAIIGGEEKTIYGVMGENLFKYKHEAFAEEIKFAAKILSKRAELLKKAIGVERARGRLSANSDAIKCEEYYSKLQNDLNSIASGINREYYKNANQIRDLYSKLKEVIRTYKNLINYGCESL